MPAEKASAENGSGEIIACIRQMSLKDDSQQFTCDSDKAGKRRIRFSEQTFWVDVFATGCKRGMRADYL